MDELLSEKEQIDAIRTWWQENGRYIISGIVIGVGLLIGWNYWNNQRDQAEIEASALYESLISDVAEVEVEAAEAKATQMYDSYDATVYASQARLAMAKLYMNVGRDQDAADELSAMLVQDDGSAMQMVARLRLAKILLYQEKPEEVIDLLQGYRDTAFAARYDEALGDAYAQQEKFEEAAEAYTAALSESQEVPTVDRILIQMKVNDLPETNPMNSPDANTATDQQDPPQGSDKAAAEVPEE